MSISTPNSLQRIAAGEDAMTNKQLDRMYVIISWLLVIFVFAVIAAEHI